MGVRGPGYIGWIPSEVPAKKLHLSDLAKQAESKKEELLNNYLDQKLGFGEKFSIDSAAATFVKHSAKKEYVENLKMHFVENAVKQGFGRGRAEVVFGNILQPKILDTDFDDLHNLEAFMKADNSAPLFMAQEENFENRVLQIKVLHKAVETVIKTVKENPGEVERILDTCGATNTVFQNLDPADQHHFLLTFLGQLETNALDYPETITRHETFVAKAKEIPGFTEHVATKSNADKGYLLKFVMTKEGNEYLMDAMDNPEKLKSTIDDLIKAQKMTSAEYG